MERKCLILSCSTRTSHIQDGGDGSRTPAWWKEDKDEFNNIYIDAQRIQAHEVVLASVVVTEKRSCQIRWGLPWPSFAKSADPEIHKR